MYSSIKKNRINSGVMKGNTCQIDIHAIHKVALGQLSQFNSIKNMYKNYLNSSYEGNEDQK
jgi:hypothetical protein